MEKWLSDSNMLYREKMREEPAYWTDSSALGIVTSAHYKATEAGVEVLSRGGNAVDAAIATSLALGVVEPAGSGLGGMAMMMIHLASTGRTFILEGPCRAPVKATPQEILMLAEAYKKDPANQPLMYNDEEVAGIVRKSGYKSIAVPTNAAVLGYALRHYGTASSSILFGPAIRLADEGYYITSFQEKILAQYTSQIKKGNAKEIFLTESLEAPEAGALFRQPVLARTLRRLADHGFEDFYTGSIGNDIVEDMRLNGGLISNEDMCDIPWPSEAEPITGSFMGMEVRSMPPPGGGTVLIEMLNIFESMLNNGFDPDTPEAALLFAMIINRARLDRRESFSKKTGGTIDLTSRAYAKQVAAELLDDMNGSGETTHLNVIDRHGNVVALTQSIERSFGSKVVTPGLGFLYNGFMKAFKVKSKKHPHYLRPGAVARSNASPTILLKDGSPLYAIGSTGSERMVSGMFQVLVRLMSQSPFEAVKAPRLHCTPERQVFLEAERFHPDAAALLKKHGFDPVPYDAWAFSVGGLHLAGVDNHGAWGVAEPRRDGASAGVKTLV